MRNYAWLRTLFLTLLAFSAAGFAAYQWIVVRPEKRCEARAGWYDSETRICATPLLISDITGRPLNQKRTPEEIAAGQARARGEPVQAARPAATGSGQAGVR
jgi:hypothetical protein